jgi:hypothetical protein
MESGSEWPGHVGDYANLVAFSQSGEKLLLRTQEKLHALQRDRQDIRVAVLACNGETTDDETEGYRTRVARALLSAVSGKTLGRLVLSASGRASEALRAELLALADTLSAQVQGTTATVSLRFTEESQP